MAIQLTSKTEDEREEIPRETLFTIDGVDYTIPARFRANIALTYARVGLLHGSEAAVSWALEEALGAAGHIALMNFEDLTPEQLRHITTVILTRIAGGMESPKAGLKAV